MTVFDGDDPACPTEDRHGTSNLESKLRAWAATQWERIPPVPHAHAGSYDRGYQNGLADVLRGIQKVLESSGVETTTADIPCPHSGCKLPLWTRHHYHATGPSGDTVNPVSEQIQPLAAQRPDAHETTANVTDRLLAIEERTKDWKHGAEYYGVHKGSPMEPEPCNCGALSLRPCPVHPEKASAKLCDHRRGVDDKDCCVMCGEPIPPLNGETGQ